MHHQYTLDRIASVPHRVDTLGALAVADVALASVADGPTAAEKRLRDRIAAHEAQVEKLLRPWVAQTAATKRAISYLTGRLGELYVALAEVEDRQLAGLRELVADVRAQLGEARRAARVDAVLARELERRDEDDLRARSRDMFSRAGVA